MIPSPNSFASLNLPQTITGEKTVTYVYTASGQKLRRISTATGTTEYVNGVQYDGGSTTPSFVLTEEGRALPNGSSYNYEYSIADHLGNSRVNFDQQGTSAAAKQENDYYAFGLQSKQQTTGTKNQYLYNKKELQEELGWYDYGARFYDPVIARWTSMDPKAEKFRRFSPFNYSEDNPVRNIDSDGMGTTDWVKKRNRYLWDDRVKNQETATRYQGSDAKYLGKTVDVYSKFTATYSGAQYTDKVHLGSDGSVSISERREGFANYELQYSRNLGDPNPVTNFNNSEFYPKRTDGFYWGVSFGVTAGVGSSFSAGFVHDAVGNINPYISISGNLGVGGGGGLDFGSITPTRSNQFLNSDFAGGGTSYSFGVTTPIVGLGYSRGGSHSERSRGSAFDPENFGSNPRGYKTSQPTVSPGGKLSIGAIFSSSNSFVF